VGFTVLEHIPIYLAIHCWDTFETRTYLDVSRFNVNGEGRSKPGGMVWRVFILYIIVFVCGRVRNEI
jgi:hypothetical protein